MKHGILVDYDKHRLLLDVGDSKEIIYIGENLCISVYKPIIPTKIPTHGRPA